MAHHHVRYASRYLVPGVSLPKGPSFHHIALHWDRSHPDAEGSCHLDPNTCGLDEFGDPTICTKMAVAPLEMKLTQIAHRGRHHAYSVECRAPGGEGYTAMPLRLVTVAHSSDLECRLLVLGADQRVERIIDLHHEPRT